MLTKSDIETIIELGKKFPNNQDLGRNARSIMREKDFMHETPNDFELGTELRKIIFRKSK